MRKMGTIHAANLDSSERLQRLLIYLQARGDAWATSRTIRRATNVEAVHTAVAELRANGAVIQCERRQVRGKLRPVYRLEKSPEGWS